MLQKINIFESVAGSVVSTGPAKCVHCGLRIPAGVSGMFCCRGCEMVFTLIHERGLDDYYRIRDQGASIRSSRPAAVSSESLNFYSHLDDPEFLNLYCQPEAGTGLRTMQFYLEGVHCTACVWLTEKVSEWVAGVRSIRLDLGHSLATVKLDSNGSFSEVAREFMKLGYRPHPVKQDEAQALEARENHRALIRMAIAGAGAGNIMLLAISVYAGATGVLQHYFEWVSFLICLPVATYSAWPFYRSALGALRSRQLSIDIPIALGLSVAFVASFISILIHSKHVYFDTVSSLVFLLLASRYVLRKTQQEALHATRLIHFLTPSMARRKRVQGSGFEEVSVDSLQAGDHVLVLAGECIPTDGIVCSGISALNLSLLTGESRPELVQPGVPVFAGTLNTQAPLEIEVQSFGSATRLGKILSSMEEHLSRKAPIVAFTDQISKAFVLISLALVGVAFYVGFTISPAEGVSRALAMAIVACPCAFAFATPLALSIAMGRFARYGVLIKGADVIEKLAHVNQVVLDKTGTLTTGQFEVKKWLIDADQVGIEEAVYALETRSTHPIARALVSFLKPRLNGREIPGVEEFSETIGRGLSGRIQSHPYEVQALNEELLNGSPNLSNDAGTQIAILKDGNRVGRVTLGDSLRTDTESAVEKLRALKLGVKILSGDGKSAVMSVANRLGVGSRDAYFKASPEYKSEVIGKMPRALMVGDGANDSIALASAYVGVAVHSGMEISMRAADVYQRQPGVMPVVHLIRASRETLKVIYRNFAFSLVYNFIGTYAAITGHVSPLFAAILMPISALTVFGSSIVGTRKLRKIYSQLSDESQEAAV
ncbi:MAG: heavy metal translocating P-type ATPase [Bdellovibrionia bacterium]